MPRVAQAPPPGIVRNATPEASHGVWYDANNVRFRGGQLQPIGGNVAITGTSVADLPRDMLTWHDNAKVRWAAFGTDTKLYAYRFDLQQLHDITPAGVGPLDPPGALVGYGMADYGEDAYGTSRDAADIGPQDIAASMGDQWSLDTFGEDLLIVPTQDGHLFRWSPLTPTVLPVLNATAPTECQGVIVTDQRHVVLLAAGGDPRNIAWSDQENPDVWVPDVTNLAGSKLLQTQSYAMAAIRLRHCADRLGLRADFAARCGQYRFVRHVAGCAVMVVIQWECPAAAMPCRGLVLLAGQPDECGACVRLAQSVILGGLGRLAGRG
jgi:hypothetical protein